jgi:hypothetical protein
MKNSVARIGFLGIFLVGCLFIFSGCVDKTARVPLTPDQQTVAKSNLGKVQGKWVCEKTYENAKHGMIVFFKGTKVSYVSDFSSQHYEDAKLRSSDTMPLYLTNWNDTPPVEVVFNPDGSLRWPAHDGISEMTFQFTSDTSATADTHTGHGIWKCEKTPQKEQ